ncbi:MAG: hypothetical protein J5U19_10165 [Candidatus Methanoperedens sp.]|nr:hypothetical protein [Candidatus Methanoperedens sp.]MCE8428741.1 hypothetical protein [Candidatus Methanoperedens sp.]
MFNGRKVFILILFLIPIISACSGANDTLFLGTGIYLSVGESYPLYQGYVLNIKGVSSDGSAWFQLADNDTIIKSEVVGSYGTFVYNKTNKTILLVQIEKIYSGSPEQNLVSLSIKQYIDHEKPTPKQTEINLKVTQNRSESNTFSRINHPGESLIWAVGIVFVLILLYIMRKLW